MRLLLLTCFALFATDASAQVRAATMSPSTSGNNDARYVLSGPTATTPISGDNGTSSFVLTSARPNAILFALWFSERGDDPCKIQSRSWIAPFGFEDNDEPFDNAIWDRCGGNSGSTRGVVSQFPASTGSVGLGGAAAIHGVQVCTNNRNGNNLKLKGVKIFASMLNQDGQGRVVRSGSYSETFERTNCRKWEQVRRCGSGQVATSLQVHFRGRSVTGLALKCRAVTVTPL